jgi:cyclopropane-fatty-acyl-phospholipid synthase
MQKIEGEVTYRIWRLFMSFGIQEFGVGRSNVFQTLLVKANEGRSGLPLSREDWYA